jgi:hypothetical protein
MTHTNLAQSKALANLGLDPKTADMTIISDAFNAYPHTAETRGKKEYPCWSAEALLDLLPRRIYEGEAEISDDIDDEDWVYALDIEKDEHSTWFIGYRHNAFLKPRGGYEITACGELLAGLFAITEWLLRHKYL